MPSIVSITPFQNSSTSSRMPLNHSLALPIASRMVFPISRFSHHVVTASLTPENHSGIVSVKNFVTLSQFTIAQIAPTMAAITATTITAAQPTLTPSAEAIAPSADITADETAGQNVCVTQAPAAERTAAALGNIAPRTALTL